MLKIVPLYCKLCIDLVVSRKRRCYFALKHVSSIVFMSLVYRTANLFSNIK